LNQTAYIFQNIFFYDDALPVENWQLFTTENTEYNFGVETSFVNKTFLLAPEVFMNHFPINSSTILGFIQHAQRFGYFMQDYRALGFGGKHPLRALLNL
jgi:hypothetical protein